jgi:hypothetical protein
MSRKLWLPGILVLTWGLAQVHAQDVEWIRAVYWDSRYRTNWAPEDVSVTVRDGLQAAGYQVLNADELKTWMNARIADKKYSVVVFARDNAPDTVVESNSSTCTLRKYLDAGGKIVLYADIPFWDIAKADGTWVNYGGGGCASILGISGVDWTNDTNSRVTLTDAGREWGLTETWTSNRWTPATGKSFTILATDAAGNPAAWVKHFVANDKFRGFVRIWDCVVSATYHPSVEDIIRVAEHVVVKATNPSPADGATGVTMPLLSWEAGSFATFHNVYLGTTPDLTEADLVSPR